MDISQNSIYKSIQPHTLFSDKIMNGDFTSDPYSEIVINKEANEEYLIFVLHGIGQNSVKINTSLKEKIGPTVENLIKYSYANNKSSPLNKQVHIRMIDWKNEIVNKNKENFEQLLDKNNETKYPKMFIQQVPLDILHYLGENRYEIHSDVVNQMNIYYTLVKKYRPLFKGNVSLVGHSMGSLILYDILKELTYDPEQAYKEGKDYKDDPNSSNLNNNSINNSAKKIYTTIENEIKKENSIFKDSMDDREILNLNRNQRTNNFKLIQQENLHFENLNDENFTIDISKNPTNNFDKSKLESNEENIYFKHIYSKSKNIKPLQFPVDHFFLLGSQLSLVLTVNHRNEACIETMETVKDFHNILHPMDPLSYRIEPLIFNYPECRSSLVLPHYANDGKRNSFFDKFLETLCMKPRQKDEGFVNHDSSIGRKRYDFIVQEYPSEKAVHVIGFLFSHQAYWNNPDVFYFIIKMIHWQGYNSAYSKVGEN